MVSMNKIKLNSYDDLFGSPEAKEAGAVEVPLEELHEFKGHPFKVIDDDDMLELAESIRCHGIMVPAIVRTRSDGGYEIISGHRRKRASELAGRHTMPVIIKECSDDESVWTMVDSNLQRENILPSEKAKAYRMKYEALKHQGIKSGGNTLDVLGDAGKESGKTVQRYIWLSRLDDDLLSLVDTKRIPFGQGVDLSFLKPEEQVWIKNIMKRQKIKISASASRQLKQLSIEEKLTEEQVKELLLVAPRVQKAFTISRTKLNDYFSDDTDPQEIETTILMLLREWKDKS